MASHPDMSVDPDAASRLAVERVFRQESGRVLATLIATLGGDFDTAEEAVQDAFLAAIEHWPREGFPDRPGAWITTTARRRAIDRLRRARRLVEKEATLQALTEADGPSDDPADLALADDVPIPDDRLRLIFTCCHPLLTPEARVALTLRTVAGIQTPAIARAFLVPEPTIAQRLVRAKRTIRTAHIPYQVPGPDELPQRLASVLLVLYLVFTEGYRQPVVPLDGARTTLDEGRSSLTAEATRLARLLTELLPDEAEVAWPAGPHAAPGGPSAGPSRRPRGAGAARGPGSSALGPGGHRRGAGGARACHPSRDPPGRTSSRPPSPSSTIWHRTRRRPTGRPSSRCSSASMSWRHHRSWPSTMPWRCR